MITYPIDYRNDRFTYDLGGDVRRRQKWIRRDGQAIEGKSPLLVVMQETIADDPVFNPETHRLGEIQWVDNAPDESTVGTHQVVALTQTEIDERAEGAADAAELEQAKAVYQDLKNGVGNNATRLQRVERVVARLLRELMLN